MDNKNDNVEKALDDIFGSDELEINVGQENDDKLYVDKDETVNKVDDDYQPSQEFKNVFDSNEAFLVNDEKKKEDETNDLSFSEPKKADTPVLSPKVSKKKSGKMILLFVLSMLGSVLLVVALFTFYVRNEKTVVCTYSADDIGYTITDRYEITYTNSKIKYVSGVYKYTVNTSDYKEQLKYVREEKLPVVVNSNGMSGFTYVYDQTDDYFKVSSYLDFDLFDYEEIDKNDNVSRPISYITINSKTNLQSLTKELKKKGYTCEVK